MNSEWMFNISDTDFEQTVLEASFKQPVLVDFWADWCSPCLVLSPVLEAVLTEHEGAWHLAKLEVDVDDNMRLAGKYKVRGFPTVIAFRNGVEGARFSSARSAQWVRQFVDEVLSI
jgi:putative thioredoxin